MDKPKDKHNEKANFAPTANAGGIWYTSAKPKLDYPTVTYSPPTPMSSSSVAVDDVSGNSYTTVK